MQRSVRSVLCAVCALLLAATLGCGDASEPPPTPTLDTRDADFAACHATCIAKGGSDSNCSTFCAGGTVEPPAKDDASKDGVAGKDADPEACYESCIAKGGDDATCRGFCEEKPGVDGAKSAADSSVFLAFEHDGVTRRYVFHAPADLPADAPLVFFLHGHGGNAGETRAWAGLDRVADTNGFAVVYPQGSGNYEGTPYWNAHTFRASTTTSAS